MSMSLLKKSMAIVEEGLPESTSKNEAKARKKDKIHKPKHILAEKTAHKKTIDDIRKEVESDKTKVEENVQKLLSLQKHSVKIPNPEKIIKRAHHGRYVVERRKPIVMESIYTEEDFIMFEKELAGIM